MKSNLIYGVVVGQVFYSNRMELKLRASCANGVYSMDMEQDDFQATLQVANLEDAAKYFRKATKVVVIRGTSFHDGLVPENPVRYPFLPVKVLDATYDEFEYVEAVILKNRIVYFLQVLDTPHAYTLLDLKQRFDSKSPADISDIKNVTPDMRVVYAFHLMERRKKEEEDPVNAIKLMMTQSGATVNSVKKTNAGYVVLWETEGHRINTLLDKNFRVKEAGFCTTNHDDTQSARSVVNLLKDYVEDGSYVHLTRTPD